MRGRPNRTADPPGVPVTTEKATGGTASASLPQEARTSAATGGQPAHDDTAAVYVISIAAELAGMHPQTLRSYDRLGIVTPGRSAGRGRRYSARDVALLREVQRLSQDEGVNLEGIRRILDLSEQVVALQAQVRALLQELEDTRTDADRRVAEAHASHRRDLVPIERSAVVVWRPGRR